jgi:hypothetical protein
LVIDARGNIFGTTTEGGNSIACRSNGEFDPGGCLAGIAGFPPKNHEPDKPTLMWVRASPLSCNVC